jgi:pyruvate formate lyase activating enzyme
VLTGVVFNIQRFSVHDGPGIRTTVFLKGCPLRCSWCHNPEGMEALPVVSLAPERCIACAACIDACPHELTGPLDGCTGLHAAMVGCDRCGLCAEVCGSEARTLLGRHTTVEELVAEVTRDRVFYEESGGGVTFSGGEPVTPANLEFLLASLRACKAAGLHCAVDTSGFASRETVLEVATWTDLILYDLKLMDDARHRETTGVSNRLILENLRALSEAGQDLWIRVPLIPGVNDHVANLEATAAFVASLPGRHPVHLLPCHHIGQDKYRRLGLAYPLAEARGQSRKDVSSLAARMQAHGLEVRVGG